MFDEDGNAHCRIGTVVKGDGDTLRCTREEDENHGTGSSRGEVKEKRKRRTQVLISHIDAVWG